MMRLLTGGGGGEGGEGGADKSQSWRRASVVAVGAKVSADAVRRCPKQSPKLLSGAPFQGKNAQNGFKT